MKQIRINFCVLILGTCFTLILSGCISISKSPTPRFYRLNMEEENKITQKINVSSDIFLGIGPVKIPEYQNRPQIVTQDKEKMLKFAQFDRWGETLDLGIGRLIGQTITQMIAQTKFTLYPWNSSIPVKYQVVIEIVQLDSQLDKDLFLVAQWLIIDAKNMKTLLIKKSEFQEPITPQNYSGLAKTLSTICIALSSQIAQALEIIEANNIADKF